jgi:four helix bundle protein
MKITRFEDIEGWRLARELCRAVGDVISKGDFAKCYALKDQIDRASGSSMDNIAEGFDGGSNAEFIRFLVYAQRSCSEVKSQLYRAHDRKLINQEEFDSIYQQASTTHAKIGGFIRYLKNYK